jgi:hypothetical protein
VPASLELRNPTRITTVNEIADNKRHELIRRHAAPPTTPTDLKPLATREVAEVLNVILADVFALYMKNKNFRWHMSGPHFRD